MNIAILTEDTYGVNFFQNLITRLKKLGTIRNEVGIKIKRYNIYKLTNLLRVAKQDYDRTIVIVDCDGSCNNGNSKEINDLINKEGTKNTIGINLEFEIEEWICISEGVNYGPEKPSDVLKSQRKYEKFRLPIYADKLKIEELLDKSESFSFFIRALNR